MSIPSVHDRATLAALAFWAAGGKSTVLPVRGISMLPVLLPGDRVRVRHGADAAGIGDIILRRADRGSIAHRVIERRVDGARTLLRTKGDANLSADPGWLDAREAVGVVVAVLGPAARLRGLGIRGRVGRSLAQLSRWQEAAVRSLTLLLGRSGSRRADTPGREARS